MAAWPWPSAYGEGHGKKTDYLWKSSVRGLTSPPPNIFGRYGTREAKFNFGHKKGKKLNFPKTLKIAIFNINLL